VCRRFGARPRELDVLAHDELESAAQPGLDGGEIDFALSLGSMGIADGEQGAGGVDRHERACRHVLVVDVTGVEPGGPELIRPIDGGGATPMVPKNGWSSAITTPGAISAFLLERLIRMKRWKTPGNSSGNAPV
jgi:hypothetical protein